MAPLLSATWDGRAAPRLAVVATAGWNGLGATPHQIWALQRAELTAFGESPFRAPSGARLTMANIQSLPPRAPVVERLRTIMQRLLRELLAPVARDLSGARIGVSLGLPERMDSYVRDPRLQRQRREIERGCVDAIRALGADPIVDVVARGHASLAFGALQVGHALGSGALEVAILGGVDSYCDPGVIENLGEQSRLFDGEHLDGFIPGEGGAFMLVARHDVARRLRWPTIGYIAAAAVNDEVGHSFSDIACMGLGLSRAAIAATDPLRNGNGSGSGAGSGGTSGAARRLDWWLSDLTPESYRVHEFQLAWPRAAAGLMSPQSSVDHLPSHLGDLGAATMATAAIIAFEGMTRRSPAASTALVTGTSLGPDRGAVLVTT